MKLPEILTYKEKIDLILIIISKQKDENKRRALNSMLRQYEHVTETIQSEGKIYTILDGFKCAKCGGIILKDVFPGVTPGGNPRVGCPVCKTFSSVRMYPLREDIIKK